MGFLLTEDGSYLLLESGDKIILDFLTLELSRTDGFVCNNTLSESMVASMSRTDGVEGSASTSEVMSVMELLRADGSKVGNVLSQLMSAILTKTDSMDISDLKSILPQLSRNDGVIVSGEKSEEMDVMQLSVEDLINVDSLNSIAAMLNVTSEISVSDSRNILAMLEKTDGLTLDDDRAITMVADFIRQDGLSVSDLIVFALLATPAGRAAILKLGHHRRF